MNKKKQKTELTSEDDQNNCVEQEKAEMCMHAVYYS
jgi:hypothetical protein